MRIKVFITAVCILFCAASTESFKTEQMRYSRVKAAFTEKENKIYAQLTEKNIQPSELELYLRAFKAEKKFEVWGKNKKNKKYILIGEYSICRTSGGLGPKRQEGDLQIPEGYYHINKFNPFSNFHLSLGINYPNPSDNLLGVQGDLGGLIFIHGACVTIGCIPLTDDKIKELYVLCVLAKNAGQVKIPINIFPRYMTEKNYQKLQDDYSTDADKLNLWEDLLKGYNYFENYRTLPVITFLDNGRHDVN